MGEFKPVYTIGVGPNLLIDQGEGSLLAKARRAAIPVHYK